MYYKLEIFIFSIKKNKSLRLKLYLQISIINHNWQRQGDRH